jgi:hypothetical protein
MSTPPNSPASKRLADQLRTNMARRKAVVRERAADPDASALTFRDAPVHDPALRTAAKPDKS